MSCSWHEETMLCAIHIVVNSTPKAFTSHVASSPLQMTQFSQPLRYPDHEQIMQVRQAEARVRTMRDPRQRKLLTRQVRETLIPTRYLQSCLKRLVCFVGTCGEGGFLEMVRGSRSCLPKHPCPNAGCRWVSILYPSPKRWPAGSHNIQGHTRLPPPAV
jgi:hypothetical protein